MLLLGPKSAEALVVIDAPDDPVFAAQVDSALSELAGSGSKCAAIYRHLRRSRHVVTLAKGAAADKGTVPDPNTDGN
ncbi:MAG TPA: hypothetical protein VFD92_01245 [Candidatus Binatia bacterium]|nr:hypothetical protein [Candidatus Binatia bacterium]